jgi:hypothetical protein
MPNAETPPRVGLIAGYSPPAISSSQVFLKDIGFNPYKSDSDGDELRNRERWTTIL